MLINLLFKLSLCCVTFSLIDQPSNKAYALLSLHPTTSLLKDRSKDGQRKQCVL